MLLLDCYSCQVHLWPEPSCIWISWEDLARNDDRIPSWKIQGCYQDDISRNFQARLGCQELPKRHFKDFSWSQYLWGKYSYQQNPVESSIVLNWLLYHWLLCSLAALLVGCFVHWLLCSLAALFIGCFVHSLAACFIHWLRRSLVAWFVWDCLFCSLAPCFVC